jgi:REP element-mobilizing transposase RayT
MVRGIERRAIFREERDRADFVDRVAALAEAKGWTVVAWALLPNHAHLLVRSGRRPLAAAMRSLVTGYAGAFNRRHKRHGHLFQNRYKSVVEEDPYLQGLARYIHLNPLRAGLVRDLTALDRYRWTEHSAVLGRVKRPWQARLRSWGTSEGGSDRPACSIGRSWPPASGGAAGPSWRPAG